MELIKILSLIIGSIIIFLYGLNLMKNSLFLLSENIIIRKLQNISHNNIYSFFIGIIVTCLCQSSTAITLIVLTLINSSYISFKSGLYIILGSNIGTTITSFLIGLNIGAFSGFILFLGFLIYMLYKDYKKQTGLLLLGLGFLFWGLNSLTDLFIIIFNNKIIANFILNMNINSEINFINGIFFTALLQSSSASIGIMQKLYTNSIFSLSSTLLFLLGANIGTTLTSLFVSFSQNKNAKKLALINTLFNFIGCGLFIVFLRPWEKIIVLLSVYLNFSLSNQIAFANLFFNTITSIIFIIILSFKKKTFS